MGVDAELYVWGPPISDEELTKACEKFDAMFDESWSHQPRLGRDPWYEGEGQLIEISLSGSRSYDTYGGRGHWPSILKRILFTMEVFPDRYLVYANDLSWFTTLGDVACCLLTHERIKEITDKWNQDHPDEKVTL